MILERSSASSKAYCSISAPKRIALPLPSLPRQVRGRSNGAPHEDFSKPAHYPPFTHRWFRFHQSHDSTCS